MSGKKPRKVRWQAVPVLDYAIGSVQVMSLDRQNRLKTLEIRTLDAFQRGEPTQEDWAIMRGTAVMARELCRMGVGAEHMPIVDKAIQALDAGWLRLEKHGRIGRVAGDHEAFTDLCELLEVQRTNIPMRQYEKSIERIGNEIRAGGHRAGVPES